MLATRLNEWTTKARRDRSRYWVAEDRRRAFAAFTRAMRCGEIGATPHLAPAGASPAKAPPEAGSSAWLRQAGP
jgi:hypothetical protein